MTPTRPARQRTPDEELLGEALRPLNPSMSRSAPGIRTPWAAEELRRRAAALEREADLEDGFAQDNEDNARTHRALAAESRTRAVECRSAAALLDGAAIPSE